jgi:hypothetical protein
MPAIPPPPPPPPLLYANNTTDDEIRSCPPWLAAGWLILLLAFGWFSLRVMFGQYDSVGQPMAAWLSIPSQPVNNPWLGRPIINGPVAGQGTSDLGKQVFFEVVWTLLSCTLIAAAAAAAMWHWPRPMLWLLLVFPFVAVVWYLTAPPAVPDATTLFVRGFGNMAGQQLSSSQRWTTVPTAFAAQVVGISVGLLTGRLLARLTVTALLPRGMRAALLPYWAGNSRP